MSAPGTPVSRSTPSARSVAQPLTSPVGSNPPGIAHGSNQPSEARLAARHSSITWWNSGGIWLSVASPRRNRLTGLVPSQVLNTASQRCRIPHALAIAARTAASARVPVTMAKEKTVPIAGSAWATGGGGSAGPVT